jgi:hypothetical protein
MLYSNSFRTAIAGLVRRREVDRTVAEPIRDIFLKIFCTLECRADARHVTLMVLERGKEQLENLRELSAITFKVDPENRFF